MRAIRVAIAFLALAAMTVGSQAQSSGNGPGGGPGGPKQEKEQGGK